MANATNIQQQASDQNSPDPDFSDLCQHFRTVCFTKKSGEVQTDLGYQLIEHSAHYYYQKKSEGNWTLDVRQLMFYINLF